jgi:hypothetical protein
MPRLLIAAAVAATLIFAPSARADFTVTAPASVTNDPVVTWSSTDGPTETQCGLATGLLDASHAPYPLFACDTPWRPEIGTDGEYTIEVHGLIFQFTVDRIPPYIQITTGPDDNSTQLSPSVVYGFSASDKHPGGITTCTWDDVPADCPDGVTPKILTPGTHVLAISVTDRVGNKATLLRHVTIASAQTIVDPGSTPTPTATPAPDVVPSEGGVLSAGATHATASLSVKKRTRAWTQLKSLRLRNVPAGTTIKVSCKGKGCPSKATTQKAAKAGSVTIKGIAGRKLRAGAKLALTLSAPSAKAQTIRILVRSTRAPRVS